MTQVVPLLDQLCIYLSIGTYTVSGTRVLWLPVLLLV